MVVCDMSCLTGCLPPRQWPYSFFCETPPPPIRFCFHYSPHPLVLLVLVSILSLYLTPIAFTDNRSATISERDLCSAAVSPSCNPLGRYLVLAMILDPAIIPISQRNCHTAHLFLALSDTHFSAVA